MSGLAGNDLDGCEAWTTNKKEEFSIKAAELWFYRRLLRVSWTERRTNESILSELGLSRTLLNTINERKLKYTGHALRNCDTQLMKTVLQGKLKSKRKLGRPSKSYIGTLKDITRLSLHQIAQRCQGRENWRRTVKSMCGSYHRTR